MKGMVAIIAAGGAKSASRERRLMKEAIVAAGRWFVGAKNVSRWRRKRERYLLCKMSLSRRA